MFKPSKAIALILLLVIFPVRVNAQTVLAEIQKTGVIKVAVREDAAPFGYLDVDRNLTGYCLDFINILQEQIKQKLNTNILTIRLLKSTPFNRFNLIEEQSVYLECGPNTIIENDKNKFAFSQPFFVTGIQFLTRKADEDKFNLNANLQGLTIGSIGNTTAENFVKERYPSANFEQFQGITGRTRGVQALKQGRIDAFVSDGILLRAEAALQQLASEDYPLLPEQPLTCDRYGMIIPQNDRQWQSLVDSVIESPQIKQIERKWFDRTFNYTEVDENLCQKQ